MSSETDPGRADRPTWLAVRARVPKGAKAAISRFLFELGATGLEETHPGLVFGDGEGPLLSGDPTEWQPPAPDSPDAHVELTGWFPGDRDPQDLALETTARLEQAGIERPAVSVERIAEEDWNAAWKADVQPFAATGRLWVVPTWRAVPPEAAGSAVLRLDPGMAFGTGTHFTTAGCLAMLDRQLAAGRGIARLLDVGTGTGILAIGAVLLGAGRAIGVDTDPLAVQAAAENARINGVEDRFEARAGSVGSLHPETFDIVVANLVAGLLSRLAPELAAAVAPGGSLIVSGLLLRQEAGVRRDIEAEGLRFADRLDDGSWGVLRFERSGR